MKTLIVVIATFILLVGSVASSRGANVDRISAETGVPVETLQAERASTGLGWGGLEKAHLLANASGQSFDTIVGKFRGGEGWGKIAHDYGLNLGKVVSSARQSSKATMHTQKVHGQKTHGKSATHSGKGHSGRMSKMQGVNHGSRGTHGMGGMGHGRGR
jgi:hypothetical protein